MVFPAPRDLRSPGRARRARGRRRIERPGTARRERLLPVAVAAEGRGEAGRRPVLADVAVEDGRRQRDPRRRRRVLRGWWKRGSASTSAAMRFRVASLGSRPTPPAMSSSRCAALVVPTRATVTAGWLITYLRKNCAQLRASSSAAHAGRDVSPTRAKRLRLRAPQLTPELLPR